jgi:hypothetical protein
MASEPAMADVVKMVAVDVVTVDIKIFPGITKNAQ